MAVDTKPKRFSMLSFEDGALLPDPDGTIDAADRAHLIWLYGGILSVVLVPVPTATEAGRGKKEKFRPKLPTINYREFQRGQREHVRTVEEKMWASTQTVEQALRDTENKSPIPKKTFEGKRPLSFGQTTPRPPVEKTAPAPQPERKKKVPAPQPTDEQRMESSRIQAANVRDQNALKAHLRATRQIAKKDNVAEEKKQREAEKDIGYTPTQIKRDRAARTQTYQRREDFAVNLEKGRIEQAKVEAVEEVRRKVLLANLKKARAAKKRKSKRKNK